MNSNFLAMLENETKGCAQLVSVVDDTQFNLAVKAVFNYGAESNAYSICNELHREIVPLRPEGSCLETPL